MPTAQCEPLRELSGSQRTTLERIVRRNNERVDVVRRAIAVLAVARTGVFIHAAREAGLQSGTTMADLVARFNRHGLTALRIASDECLATESTEIVGRLTAGVGLVPEAGDEVHEFAIGEASQQVAETDKGRQQCRDPRVAEGERGACRPSAVVDGRVTWVRVTTSGAGCEVCASASHRRWLAESPTARRAVQFIAQTRRPIPKSRVSPMTTSVRSATPSLKYCFRRHDLYVQDNCGLPPRVTILVRNRPGCVA
jgi:hypothetical protein